MSRGMSILMSSCVIGLAAAMPAAAASPSSVTATGSGQVRVLPKNRHNNASIEVAFLAARKAAVAGAISNAHQFALLYARRAGLTLGPVESVSDQQTSGAFYGPGQVEGPFGPGQFCGTERRPIFERVNGRQKLHGFKKVYRCDVPRFAYTTLTLTYAAT